MGDFSKPEKCTCGASVSFYGKKSRGWGCGHREKWDGMNWVKWTMCPIPAMVITSRTEADLLKKTNIQLRNTISALTEQVAELEDRLKRALNETGHLTKKAVD